MEWVEVTARSVDEAKDEALDQLGVDESEAEFEVLEHPKAGLFGRLRSEARVRARVAPNSPRPKVERRERRPGGRRGGSRSNGNDRADQRSGSQSGGSQRGGSESGGSESGGSAAGGSSRRRPDASGPGAPKPARKRQGRPSRASENERKDMGESVEDQAVAEAGEEEDVAGHEDEVAVAEGFLAGLLDVFGASYELQPRDLDDDLVEINVTGDGLGFLIGPRGQTLLAVQELTRTVVQRQARKPGGRILVDVGGYRQARREALTRFTHEVAEQVRSSGVTRVLEPMPPADRKVIHDAVNLIEGVSTTSEGEEPRRRVAIVADSPGAAAANDGGSGD